MAGYVVGSMSRLRHEARRLSLRATPISPPMRSVVCLNRSSVSINGQPHAGRGRSSAAVDVMTARVFVALSLTLALLPSTFAQSPTGTIAQVDVRAEVAAALFAASATQAAAERVADAKLRAQRNEIEGLRAQVRGGAAQLRAALTAAEVKYVAALAARDRAYAQEIAVFRAAVEDIAKTPEGVAALARFNAGDEEGAVAILDKLRAARGAARTKRADIESAAEGRLIATLALEARAKGKFTTVQVITRFEEITRLDPGVSWDWVELGRLYKDAGQLRDALRAAKSAAETAENDRDRAAALGAAGDVQRVQGDLAASLASYQASLAIAERLVKTDPSNVEWQRDLSVSYDRIGDVQVERGDLPAALTNYRVSLAIRIRLAQSEPDNAVRQRDPLISHDRIGQVSFRQGDLQAALASYRAALAISDRLAMADPDNAARQYDRSLSHSKIGDVQAAQGDLPTGLASYRTALALAEGSAKADPSNAERRRTRRSVTPRSATCTGLRATSPRRSLVTGPSLVIAERLATTDPSNAEWQRDLWGSRGSIGNVQLAQGDLPAALTSFTETLVTAERLAKVDPGNPWKQQDLALSHEKIGDVQRAQGKLLAAVMSYRASLTIAERLARADPGNARWQRNLIVSYVKLSEATGDKAYATQALNVAVAMQQRGILAPRRRLDDRRLETARESMNEVFVSYKREDEARVGRLVQALEGTGLSIWWDRGLAGWRELARADSICTRCGQMRDRRLDRRKRWPGGRFRSRRGGPGQASWSAGAGHAGQG